MACKTLINRKPIIYVNDEENKEPKTTMCGVSLGSLLGSILFLLYVNDLLKKRDGIYLVQLCLLTILTYF